MGCRLNAGASLRTLIDADLRLRSCAGEEPCHIIAVAAVRIVFWGQYKNSELFCPVQIPSSCGIVSGTAAHVTTPLRGSDVGKEPNLQHD